MAGDWIKLDTTTPDKPEVFQIADALGIDPDAVVGKLTRTWIWADQQSSGGTAPVPRPSLVDRLAGMPGFCDAMIGVGFLTRFEGELHLQALEGE